MFSLDTAALRRMLNLNVPIARNTVAIEPIWKVGEFTKFYIGHSDSICCVSILRHCSNACM